MANEINAHNLVANATESWIVVGSNPHDRLNTEFAHLDTDWAS